MLLRNLLPLLSVVLSVQAFTLPADTTDGVFTARVENGVEIHEKVKDLPPSREIRSKRRSMSAPTTPLPHVLARQASQTQRIHCGCDRRMIGHVTDDAVATLKAQLDGDQFNYRSGSYSYYIIRGNVVAFLCYTGTISRRPLNSGEYARLLQDVTSACGIYVAGTASIDRKRLDGSNDWTNYDAGYMQMLSGTEFCRDARKSPDQWC